MVRQIAIMLAAGLVIAPVAASQDALTTGSDLPADARFSNAVDLDISSLPVDYLPEGQTSRLSVYSLDAPSRMTIATAACLGASAPDFNGSCDKVLMAPRTQTEGAFALSEAVALGGGAIYSRNAVRSYAALSWRADDSVTVRMRSNLTEFATVQAAITW